MKKLSWKMLKGSAILGVSAAMVAAATIPIVSTSSKRDNFTTLKNDATSNAVVYSYEPLTITDGYRKNVISSNSSSSGTTGWKNVQAVDDPNDRTNSTNLEKTGSSFNAASLFVNSTAGGTTSSSYPGLPDPDDDGFINISSEASPTTGGVTDLYWKIPCSKTSSVNNAMKLYGASTASTATDTFTFKDLGVYQKLYILCILGQCNGGSGQIKVTINYTSGQSSSETYTIYDWFPSDDNLKKLKEDGLFATDNYSRVWFHGKTPTEEWNSGAADGKVVFNQIPITVDTSRVIESLTINLVRDSSYEDSTLTIYGVTGQYASNINPPTVTVTNVGKTSATVNWTKPAAGDSPNYYYLDIYHKNAAGELVYDKSSVQYTSTVFTTDISDLSESTTYYAVMRSGIEDTSTGTTKIVQSENSNVVEFTTLTGVTTVSVPNTTIYVGDTGKQLTVTCYGSDGTTKSTDQSLSNFTYSPTDVVTLTKVTTTTTDPQVYNITINKAGTVTVTATSTDGSVTGTGTIDVKVKAPTASAGGDVTHHSFTANWSPPATGTYTYTLQVADNSSFTSPTTYSDLTETSQSIEDLAQTDEYWYRVKAINNSVESEWSNSIKVTTETLAAPVISTLTAPTYKSATVTWATTTQATTSDYKYVAEISTDNFTTTTATQDIAYDAEPTVTFTGLPTKSSTVTSYYARVKVVYNNGTQDSAYSSTLSVTVPNIPANELTLDKDLITINVLGSDTVTSTISGPDTGEIATVQTVTSSADKYSDCIEISTDSTNKIHTIKAKKAIPSSDYITVTFKSTEKETAQASVKVYINFPAPVATAAENVTPGSFTAKWNAVDGADKYHLVVKDSSSAIVYEKADLTTTSQSITGLEHGATYTYTVTAINNGPTSVGSITSSESNTISVTTEVQHATGVTATASLTMLKGDTKEAQTAVQGQDWSGTYYYATNQAVTNTPSVTGFVNVTTSETAKTYVKHNVEAVKEGDLSIEWKSVDDTSKTATTNVSILKAETVAATNVLPYSFTANWKDVGAASYRISLAYDSEFKSLVEGYEDVQVTGATSLAITNLQPRKNYYYHVCYENAGKTSDYSLAEYVKTTSDINGFEIDTTSKEVLLGEEITVNSKVKYGDKEATSQVVTSKRISGNATVELTDNEKVHTIKATSEGSDNKAVIRYTVSEDTSYTKDCTITVKKAVANAATDVSQYSFTANWEDNGAESYLLYVAYDPNFENYVEGYDGKSVTGSSETLNGLSPKTTYYYRIRYVNNDCISELSGTQNVTTPTDVTDLSLNKGTLNVIIGEYDQSLIATVQTVDPSGKQVKWSVADSSMASVWEIPSNDNTSKLQVKGLKVGQTTIIATIDGYPELTKTCTLNIANATIGTPDPKVKDITTSSFTTYWDKVKSSTPVTYTVSVWIEHDDGSKESVTEVSTQGTEVVIEGLADDTTYKFTVKAVNDYVSATSKVITVQTSKKVIWPIIVGASVGGASFFILLLFGLYLLWKNSILKTYKYDKSKGKGKKGKKKGKQNTHDKMFRAMDKTIVLNNQKTLKRKNSLYTRFGTKDEQRRKGYKV